MQGRFERRVGLGARADFFCAGLPAWFRRLFFVLFKDGKEWRDECAPRLRKGAVVRLVGRDALDREDGRGLPCGANARGAFGGLLVREEKG